jgi:hypothetical protein
LRRRIWKFGLDRWAAARLEARVDAIQRRLHKYDKPLRVRQAEARAAALAAAPAPIGAELELTWAELEHLEHLFAGANNPLSASIGAKAAAALGGSRDAGGGERLILGESDGLGA